MMEKVNSRERLVKLMEIFMTETGEEKKLPLDDIILKLQEEFAKKYQIEYCVDRKTVKADIEKLKEINFFIEEFVGTKGKKFYYYGRELFELYEIRILLDAVYSARSITNQERENLITKIKTLTNKGNLKINDSKLYILQMIASENTLSKYYLDEIHNAIFSSKILTFY